MPEKKSSVVEILLNLHLGEGMTGDRNERRPRNGQRQGDGVQAEKKNRMIRMGGP